eukprot:SAG11_NODE_9239_length_929_cov_5.004819_2_plen_64_part_01
MLHQGGPFWRLITALVDSGCSHTLVFDSLNDIAQLRVLNEGLLVPPFFAVGRHHAVWLLVVWIV